ncbi:MAG: response regulator transcription factor [Xanthomonadales bacterium]|nr:response regulator transcription factor [Xanthomonadales bacterium]MCC6561504.1 response regulator transcription factor [Xanthomonadales bacterium]
MSAFASALVIDDLDHCRDWLALALALAFPGIDVRFADSVASGHAALASPPPLVLCDLGLPDGSGLELIERLAREAPQVQVVVSTVFDDDAHLFPALRAGAHGYLLKDATIETIAELLGGIVAGQPPLSPSIARRLLRHFQPAATTPAPAVEADPLTARERDVLRLIAKGLTVADTAGALQLTRHTVAGYVKDIYRKLQINSRAEATLEATRRGLVGAGAR